MIINQVSAANNLNPAKFLGLHDDTGRSFPRAALDVITILGYCHNHWTTGWNAILLEHKYGISCLHGCPIRSAANYETRLG